MKYVANAKNDACIFCDGSTQSPDSDEANYILARTPCCFVMMNLYPYSIGHLMIIPYQHSGKLSDLPPQVLSSLMQLTQVCEQVLQQVYAPQGFNIGINIGTAGGAGFAGHLHAHIVPRWYGDSNYMTTVGDVRVLPECLTDTYQRLKPVFDRQRAVEKNP